MTNSIYEVQEEPTPAEKQVRSAFESTFHPLTKLEELDILKELAGDYGPKAVIKAIEKASGSVKELVKRRTLSPRYLLSILQDGEWQQSAQKQPQAPSKLGLVWAEPFIE